MSGDNDGDKLGDILASMINRLGMGPKSHDIFLEDLVNQHTVIIYFLFIILVSVLIFIFLLLTTICIYYYKDYFFLIYESVYKFIRKISNFIS